MLYKLFLLGGARVEGANGPVSSRATQRRRLAVLSLLALAPRRTLTRERILGYLWADSAPDSARKLLSEAVYVIRRELTDDAIVAVGDELSLGPSVETDVDRFVEECEAERFAEAVSIYAGPLLDGWYVRGAPEFERWMEAERTRLSEMFSMALRKLAEAAELENDFVAAAKWWHAFVRLDPYGGEGVKRLARTLASTGERAGALHALASHEALLQAELGVGLDRTLQVLKEQIRDGSLPRSRPVTDDVQTIAEARRSAPQPIQTPFAASTSATTVAVGARTSRRKLVGAVVAGAAIIACLGAFAWWIEPTDAGNDATAAADRSSRQKIAVMYFKDSSPAQNLGYLADGLTEGLIEDLMGIRALRVLSVDAVQRFRGKPLDVQTIQKELHVGTMVSATLRSANDSVFLAYRIVDAKTGEQLAGESIGRPFDQPVALAAELSLRVANALRLRLGVESINIERNRLKRRRDLNNEAVSLMYKARELRMLTANARNAPGDSAAGLQAQRNLRLADSLLSRAEDLNPQWPALAIERGWVAATVGRLEHGTARVMAILPGLSNAEHALSLVRAQRPPDSLLLSQSLYLRGTLRVKTATAVQTFRPESTAIRKGIEDLRDALAIDSTIAGAWAVSSMANWVVGNFEESERAATNALASDAFLADAPEVITWAWKSASAIGHRDVAEKWCDRGRKTVQRDWHFVECPLTLMRRDAAALDGRKPDVEKAWKIVRELERIDPSSKAAERGHPYSPYYRQLVVASLLAASNRGDSARGILTRTLLAVDHNDELKIDVLLDAAFVLYLLGDASVADAKVAAYLKARPDLGAYAAREPAMSAARNWLR